MPIPARGLTTVRTLSAVKQSGTQGTGRHVQQFRLAALELECSRLLREKQAAERRIDGIQSRITEIKEQMRECRDLLDRDEILEEPSAPRGAPRILRY